MTPPGSREDVLVVDDDDELRPLVAAVLESEGLRVETASNGLEALASLERSMPRLILLDMRMPVMNGWQFARQFLKMHDHEVPIVVMTAAMDAELRAREIAAEGWIGKPFDIDLLLSTAKRFLRRPGAV